MYEKLKIVLKNTSLYNQEISAQPKFNIFLLKQRFEWILMNEVS